VVNLFDMVGSDLNYLAGTVTGCLDDPRALRAARQMVDGSPEAEVFDKLDLADKGLRERVALLALGTDCLNRVSEAILADGQVEQEELDVAFTLVGPVANYFSQVLDRYAGFANLEPTETVEFLVEFRNDRGWFGGHAERCIPYFGATLCCVTSILLNDPKTFDIYEHMIEDVMVGVMDSEGGDAMNRVERRVVRRVQEFHKSFRETISSYASQPSRRESEPESKGLPQGVPFGDSRPPQPSPAAKACQTPPEEALRQASGELDALIGLPEVKAEVKRLMSFLTVQQERQKHGLQASTQSLHFVFTGNPGTGKTTVARILGSIFYGFGILKSAKMVECDRAKVVGGYLGQTAIKMDEVIQSALDGVLFIDEAYTLAGDAAKFGQGDMYGEEAINTLLKRMEDFRSQLIVIAAGYPQPMQKFLHSNPGLESRFTRFINFGDYTVSDLCRIFDSFCRSSEYTLTPNACAQAYLLFTAAYSQRDERFGNARFVRNIYEQVVGLHSERLANTAGGIDKTALVTLDGQDVPRFSESGFDPTAINFMESRWEAVCPGCGKESSAGFNYLGQRVSCKCGQKFLFPWWCPVLNSIRGVPAGLLASVSPADKRGIVILAR